MYCIVKSEAPWPGPGKETKFLLLNWANSIAVHMEVTSVLRGGGGQTKNPCNFTFLFIENERS